LVAEASKHTHRKLCERKVIFSFPEITPRGAFKQIKANKSGSTW
jgi:hypothetical protein